MHVVWQGPSLAHHCFHILITFALVLPCSVPAAERMQRDVVGFKLAVRVQQQASQAAPEPRLPVLERPQEETPRVVVIGVQVVPDQRRPLQDSFHLCQGVRAQFSGNDLVPCWQKGKSLSSTSGGFNNSAFEKNHGIPRTEPTKMLTISI